MALIILVLIYNDEFPKIDLLIIAVEFFVMVFVTLRSLTYNS